MEEGKETYHIPALLQEAIEGLNIKSDGIYVDATFGGGGHSRAILETLGINGRLFGFDQDSDALANCPGDERFTFVLSNFKYMRNFLKFHGVEKVDGILADLGVSFHHFYSPERGFSFRADAPLDMRMNQKSGITAKEIVNTYSEKQLIDILAAYGDLKKPFPVAKAILNARAEKEIETTAQLAEAVIPTVNPRQEKKELAQIFQALRIEVNSEMNALRHFLEALPSLLTEGGRVAVITYHSLEDRMVKNFFRSGNISGEIEKDFFGNVNAPLKLITRQPITPSEDEVERNPRSRSAKLRVAEKI